MSNVLLLVHRVPFPPDKGDKIRSWHLLRYLSARHDVYLGAFFDDPADLQYENHLKRYCAGVFLRPVGGWRSGIRAAFALLRHGSLSVAYFQDKQMRDWVSKVLSQRPIDTFIAFSSTMAQYFPQESGAPTLIADFVDVDSDKWRQYARETRWPRSAVYAYESRALAKWEAAVLSCADVVTVVSQAERRIMPDASEEIVRKVRVVPNGVDMQYFDPAEDWADPYEGNGQIVVFTGAMDYHANVDGVCWFVQDVWPAVREACPSARFYIVGNNPTATVKALSAHPGVVVTGRVPDVRPWLRHANVAVAPLRLARGVQNKVLEALAMELCVVARPEALRGLEAPLPSGVIVAESAKEFSGALIQCLKGSNVCSCGAGRAYARQHYGWEANLAHLDEAIRLADRIVVDTSTTCASAGA